MSIPLSLLGSNFLDIQYCTSGSGLFSVVMSHSVESSRGHTDGRIDLVAENGGFCSDLFDINENARSNQQANE